jgi:hypothetical protein
MGTKQGTPDPNDDEVLAQQNFVELDETLGQAEQDLQTVYTLSLHLTRYDAKLMVDAYKRAVAGDMKSTYLLWLELINVVKALKEQIEDDQDDKL